MKIKPTRKAYHTGKSVLFFENDVHIGTQDVSEKSLHWIENVIENWENFILNEVTQQKDAVTSAIDFLETQIDDHFWENPDDDYENGVLVGLTKTRNTLIEIRDRDKKEQETVISGARSSGEFLSEG